jgi:hypothetical protein
MVATSPCFNPLVEVILGLGRKQLIRLHDTAAIATQITVKRRLIAVISLHELDVILPNTTE